MNFDLLHKNKINIELRASEATALINILFKVSENEKIDEDDEFMVNLVGAKIHSQFKEKLDMIIQNKNLRLYNHVNSNRLQYNCLS